MPNYLNADEIDTLNRVVVIFLESAELRAKKRQDLTMDFWRDNVDKILEFQDKQVLRGTGRISHAAMEEKIRRIYSEYDQQRKVTEADEADDRDLDELKTLENRVRKGNENIRFL